MILHSNPRLCGCAHSIPARRSTKEKLQEAKINIFYIETDPFKAAESMVDRHVVKMVLETAQLLSTAHRILDGTEYMGKSVSGQRNVKRWLLPDDRETKLYSATHINHPSAVWVRKSNNNYNWLFAHFCGLLTEYSYRYSKAHKCSALLISLKSLPDNIPTGYLTPPTPAMPDEYKVGADVLASYRKYYKHGKMHLHKYTKRQMPDWLKDENENIQTVRLGDEISA